jgi:hypothetical protein
MLLLALLLAAGPPLKAPSPLQAKATGPYSASISWKAPVDALAVEIEIRRTQKGHWTRLMLQLARPAGFTAHALPPGTALELRARSWNGRAPSEWTKPVPLHTQPYLEPPLKVDSPCVPREKLLEAALGNKDDDVPECRARKLQASDLQAGSLKLVLVDPLEEGCHGNGGSVLSAFAELQGCLRFVGELIEGSEPLAVPGASLLPLHSYWHESAASGEASIVELREGRLRVVDSGPVDSNSSADLPRTTDFEVVEQLQGAAGAAALRD